MKQYETSATIQGREQSIVYRVIEEDNGIAYEGLLGKMAFRFSRDDNGFVYSPSLDDISVRKPVIAAVLDREDTRLNK